LVVCLCADWCGTCREYRAHFELLQTQFPQACFQWIDVEDDADLVDPIEVENFPTLLIATASEVKFFGTVTPHVETLQRLIRTQLLPEAAALAPYADRDELAKRLWARQLE
jgi:thiol-disulfide isomerase/thioredoxin